MITKDPRFARTVMLKLDWDLLLHRFEIVLRSMVSSLRGFDSFEDMLDREQMVVKKELELLEKDLESAEKTELQLKRNFEISPACEEVRKKHERAKLTLKRLNRKIKIREETLQDILACRLDPRFRMLLTNQPLYDRASLIILVVAAFWIVLLVFSCLIYN